LTYTNDQISEFMTILRVKKYECVFSDWLHTEASASSVHFKSCKSQLVVTVSRNFHLLCESGFCDPFTSRMTTTIGDFTFAKNQIFRIAYLSTIIVMQVSEMTGDDIGGVSEGSNQLSEIPKKEETF